jgi:tetratricopeptide (TPR) repeat protein
MHKTLVLLTLAAPLLFSFSSPKKSTESRPTETSGPRYMLDYNAGVDAQNRRDYQTAVEMYKKSLSQKPDFPEALNNLGYSYRQIAKSYLAKSGDAYQKALSLDPKHVEALEYQGEYFLLMGQLMNAYQNYETLQPLDVKQAGLLKKQLDRILKQAEDVLKKYKPD